MRSRLSAFTAKAALLAALLLCAPAQAQNYTCPTAPLGTNNNQCASTAFVQGTAFGGQSITVGTSPILSGTSGRVLYDNAGVLGEYAITGTGSAVLGTSPTIATPAISSPTFSGTVAGANTIPLSILAQGAANTMPGNWTGSTANVIANTMPSCPDTGGNHLNYVNGTGITCGTDSGGGITALTGDVTATGPGSVAATLATAQPGAHTWAAAQTFSAAIKYGGVTLANSVTGTGSMVLGTSPTIASPTITGAFTATGLVTNADLVNAATTVNGQTCTLGSTCIVSTAGITIGTTTITSGTTTRILYDNAGVVGEYTITGSGTVVAMQTSPVFTTPNIGVATGTSLALNSATIGSNAIAGIGQFASFGATTTGPGFYSYLNGDTFARVAIGLDANDVPRLSMGSGSGARDVFLTRTAAATWQLGQSDSSTPVAQILQAQSVVAGNANVAGQDLSIYGSKSTGSAASGAIKFYTSPSGGSGTAQNAGVLTATIATGAVSVNSASFGLSGNISAAAWTTNGVRYKNVAATVTDTSSSGTVATAYTDVWGGNTVAASNSTTYTAYYGSYFKVPVVGSNVTFTNAYALGADSIGSPAFIATSANIITDSTTSRTLSASDNGKTIVFTNGSAVTVTVPAGLGAAFSVTVVQNGAGQVGFTASSTTINSYTGLTHIVGQFGNATLFSTAADVYLLTGGLT